MNPEDLKNLTETIKMLSEFIETKPSEWLPLYAALGGAIAGAIASFFPTFLLERYREKRFANRLRASLISEISALLEIIKKRNYDESIKNIINNLKAQPPKTVASFTVNIPEHYSRIFQENCKNIGVIDDFYSTKIVIFHQLIDAVVQDVKPGGHLSLGAELESFIESEAILSQAIHIGNEIQNKREG